MLVATIHGKIACEPELSAPEQVQWSPWSRDIVAESQTDEWLDRGRVGELLTELRTADQPSKRIARQVWEILVFMVWHGIFVEERIKPEIPETVYPVTL